MNKKLREKYGEVDITFEHFDTWEDAQREVGQDECPIYIYIAEEEKLYIKNYKF